MTKLPPKPKKRPAFKRRVPDWQKERPDRKKLAALARMARNGVVPA